MVVVVVAVGLLAALAGAQEQAKLLPFGSAWRYRDTGADLGAAWRAAEFDDSGWPAGPAPLGYGETYLQTTVGYGDNAREKPATVYFRCGFEVTETDPAARLRLAIRYDDSFAAWLNGQLLTKAGLPDAFTAATYAGSHEGDVVETIDGLSTAALRIGHNVLAIEVHQTGATSSDITLDAELSLAVPVPDFVIRPYLQALTGDGVSIRWETPDEQPGRVDYGLDSLPPGQYPETAERAEPADIQRVRLAGLQPGTRYRYRVRYAAQVATGTFTTAPATRRGIRFAVLGDTRNWGTRWETNGFPLHLLQRRPEFIVNTGDLVVNGTQRGLWPEHFRRFAGTDPVIPTIGIRANHEHGWGTPAADDWYARYFEQAGGEPYTSFDWGDVHLAYVSYPMERTPEGAAWLDQDLAASDRTWKLVAFHVPTWCTGYHSGSDSRKIAGYAPLDEVFDRRDVDLALLGHTHTYERTWGLRGGQRDDRRGTVHLISAGMLGSGFPEWFSAVTVTEEAADFPHYALVTTADDRLDVESFALVDGTLGAPEPRIERIDHYTRWRDEAVPRAELAKLASADVATRLDGIEQVGAMIYQPAVDALLARLSAGGQDERRAAALALSRIGSEQVPAKVVGLLADPDQVVRRRLARAVEIAMPEALAEQVRAVVLDPAQDLLVRVCCLGALHRHAPAVGMSVARGLLAEAETLLRQRAIDVFKRLAGEGDVPTLKELAASADRYAADAAKWALARLGVK